MDLRRGSLTRSGNQPWTVADDYEFMQVELVTLLQKKVRLYLP
jgi:predicted protein tyrosine phosphatase